MAAVGIEVVDPVFSTVPLERTAEVEREEPPERPSEARESDEALRSMGIGRNVDMLA